VKTKVMWVFMWGRPFRRRGEQHPNYDISGYASVVLQIDSA
jgi:hypothetical protein